MSEWKEVKIQDICQAQNGYAFKSQDFLEDGDFKVIKIKEIKDGSVLYTNDTASIKYNDTLKKFKVEKNDVIFALTGDPSSRPNPNSWVGRVARYIYEKPAIINQRVGKIIFGNEINSIFFFYYFRQSKVLKSLSDKAKGSASQANISTNDILDMVIKLPEMSTQQRIASILSSLDAKIENNNKINAKLEEIAQNLFKEWFVDFGPFKNGKFVESELGLIPEGWRVGSVYEYVNVVYGAPYKSSKFNENGQGLPLIRIRDLKTGKSQIYTDEILTQTEYVNSGDILAGMDAEFIPYIWKGCKGLLNQRVCKLKPQKDGIDGLFCMNFMYPHLFFTQSYKVGTTVSHIGKSDFDKFMSILPPYDVVLQYSNIVAPMRQEIIRLSNETDNLKKLRDTLLPKLMSGEIEV